MPKHTAQDYSTLINSALNSTGKDQKKALNAIGTKLQEDKKQHSKNKKVELTGEIIKKAYGKRKKTFLHLIAETGREDLLNLVMVDLGLLYVSHLHLKTDDGDTFLHTAAKNGQFKLCQNLIDNITKTNAAKKELPKIINNTNQHGETPLHKAAFKGHADICSLFLDNGATLEAKDKLGNTPLHLALIYNHKETTALLVDKGANILAVNNNMKSPYSIIHSINQDDAASLLAARFSNNGADKHGFKPIHRFAEVYDTNSCIKLINEGANINERSTSNQDTPLIRVLKANTPTDTQEGNNVIKERLYNMVKFLLNNGADPKLKDAADFTPLHFAAMYGDAKICKLLLIHGASVNEQTGGRKDFTPLHFAAKSGDLECCKVLVEAGANPESIAGSYGGRSVVHEAGDNEDVKNYLKNIITQFKNGQRSSTPDIPDADKAETSRRHKGKSKLNPTNFPSSSTHTAKTNTGNRGFQI